MRNRHQYAVGLIVCAFLAPLSSQGVIRSFDGAGSSDRLGISVASAGDVNADGYDDLVFGAPNANGGVGQVLVYSGVSSAVLHSIDGAPGILNFGQSVDGAGDVNGDGFGDFIVGASDAIAAGSATVFSGLDGSVLHTFVGSAQFELFALSVGGAGDCNGDGFADVVIGAPWAGNNGFQSGRVTIYSGVDGSTIAFQDGAGENARLGWSVSGAGDVNADGFADVIAGAIGQSGVANPLDGEAFVISGMDGSTLHSLTSDEADAFGWSVDGAGDVNGDGFADVIVGATSGGVSGAGRATVFSGFDGAILHTFDGAAGGDEFGHGVAGIGDVDQDGFDDVAVGARLAAANGTASGQVTVYSGADGSVYETFDGVGPDQSFGHDVAGGGDVDNDGFPDVIVGAPGDPVGATAGNASVFTLRAPSFHVIHGVACPLGNGQLPSISLAGQPAPGSSFAIELTAAPPTATVALVIGAPAPPLDLGILGAPGCFLDSNLGGIVNAATDAFGQASLTLNLAQDTALRRTQIEANWIAIDFTANPLGVVTSNACSIFVGD